MGMNGLGDGDQLNRPRKPEPATQRLKTFGFIHRNPPMRSDRGCPVNS